MEQSYITRSSHWQLGNRMLLAIGRYGQLNYRQKNVCVGN